MYAMNDFNTLFPNFLNQCTQLNGAMMPVASAHSRANGIRHAISDVVFWNGSLIAVSRASAEILKFAAAGVVS